MRVEVSSCLGTILHKSQHKHYYGNVAQSCSYTYYICDHYNHAHDNTSGGMISYRLQLDGNDLVVD